MISLWSLCSAMVWFSVSTLLLFSVRRNTDFLIRYGVMAWSMAMVLTVVRLLLPLDDSRVFVVRSYHILPAVYDALSYELVAGLSVSSLLIALWVIGALVRLSIALQKLLREAWQLHRSMRLPAPEPIRKAAPQYGVAPSRVWVSSAVSTPMTVGLLRPRIYFPVTGCSEAALPCILKHESCHIAGHDAWVKLGFLVFRCVFWWNPLMRLAQESVHDILELRCDQAALAGSSKEEQLAYVQAISDTAHQALDPATAFTSAASFVQPEDDDFLLLRAKLAFETSRPSKWRVRSMIALFVALFFFSYSFIVQPAMFPAEEDGDVPIHIFTSETSYLKKAPSGEYELWSNGECVGFFPADALGDELFQDLEVIP